MVTRLAVDGDGWLPTLTRIPSPNFDERPAGAVIDLVVIHAISLPPDEFGGPGIIELFTNRLDPAAHPYYADICHLRVSSHFLIRRDGMMLQFVPCEKRAWHAGASAWQGRSACNDFSLGIELEGCDRLPFANAQYDSLRQLLDALRRRYPIADVVGHSEISPGRKTDPGPCFEWGRVRNSAM